MRGSTPRGCGSPRAGILPSTCPRSRRPWSRRSDSAASRTPSVAQRIGSGRLAGGVRLPGRGQRLIPGRDRRDGEAIQVKLLRVLQDRWFSRVGEPRLDLRAFHGKAIVATRRDLAAAIREGRNRSRGWCQPARIIPVDRSRPSQGGLQRSHRVAARRAAGASDAGPSLDGFPERSHRSSIRPVIRRSRLRGTHAPGGPGRRPRWGRRAEGAGERRCSRSTAAWPGR